VAATAHIAKCAQPAIVGNRVKQVHNMVKTTIKIDGMMCSMCEAHICDAIRRAFPSAKKVKASRKKKEASFISEESVDKEELEKVIRNTGYDFISVS